MFQHAPPGYRFRRVSRLTDLRVSKPERSLYVRVAVLSSLGSAARSSALPATSCGGSGLYAVGVAAGDAAGIGSALASV